MAPGYVLRQNPELMLERLLFAFIEQLGERWRANTPAAAASGDPRQAGTAASTAGTVPGTEAGRRTEYDAGEAEGSAAAVAGYGH